MRLWTLVAILLTACGQAGEQPLCQTACGLYFVGEFKQQKLLDKTPIWSCATLQVIEDSVLDQFPKADDWRMQSTCETIRGFQVWQHSEVWWEHTKPDGSQIAVSGITHCRENLTNAAHTIEIGGAAPDATSLQHELAHAVQYCNPGACIHPGVDEDHACWEEDNVYRSIEAAKAQANAVLEEP